MLLDYFCLTCYKGSMTRRIPPLPARIMGVDVGGTKVRTLVADTTGRIVDESRELTEADVVAQIARGVHARADDAIAALGVGVPGVVDPHTGRLSRIPNVPALEGVRLADELSMLLDIPVTVENDLAAAALAEAESSESGRILAVIAAGTGIGLGIVHDGALVHGARGAAGEIGDILMPTGERLEDVVSIAGIRRQHLAHGGTDADLATILDRAAGGDTPALAAIDEYAQGLAFAVRAVRAVLDPDRLVLTGGLASARVILDALDRRLGDEMSALSFSDHGPDSPAHGALLLAQRAAANTARSATASS